MPEKVAEAAARAGEIGNGVTVGVVTAAVIGISGLAIKAGRYIVGIDARIKENKESVDELRREIETRDARREEDREDVREIKQDVKALTQHLLNRSE